MKVLITEMIHEDGIELLKQHGEVDCRFGITRAELSECIKDYDILIVRSDTPVDKELIDLGVELKAIGMAGIGINHIDSEYAKEKGIAVFNVVDGSNDAVAELTLALLLNMYRKIHLAVRDTKQGIWNKTGYTGNQIKGKTIGLVAMGKIGSKVAKLCQAFGMEVIAFDPYLDPKIAEELDVELLSLEETLKRSDIISVHAPLTKSTYHMIGKDQIHMMKDGATILNLGRGGVIDEDALYDGLTNGKLAYGAVDVLEVEPPGLARLFTLDNFIATPHIGAGTIEAQQYIATSLADKVINHYNSLLQTENV